MIMQIICIRKLYGGFMKKIYRILLLALMIGVASGCTRQNNDVNNQKVQEQKEKVMTNQLKSPIQRNYMLVSIRLNIWQKKSPRIKLMW